MARHRRGSKKVGMPQLPRRMRSANLAFTKPRPSATLDDSARFLDPPYNLAIDPPTAALPVPFLDHEGTSRMV